MDLKTVERLLENVGLNRISPTRLAVKWGRQVLPVWEHDPLSGHAADVRPRQAIEAAEAWVECPCDRHAQDAATAANAAWEAGDEAARDADRHSISDNRIRAAYVAAQAASIVRQQPAKALATLKTLARHVAQVASASDIPFEPEADVIAELWPAESPAVIELAARLVRPDSDLRTLRTTCKAATEP